MLLGASRSIFCQTRRDEGWVIIRDFVLLGTKMNYCAINPLLPAQLARPCSGAKPHTGHPFTGASVRTNAALAAARVRSGAGRRPAGPRSAPGGRPSQLVGMNGD